MKTKLNFSFICSAMVMFGLLVLGCGNAVAQSLLASPSPLPAPSSIEALSSRKWAVSTNVDMGIKFPMRIGHPVTWEIKNVLGSHARAFIPFYSKGTTTSVANIYLISAPFSSTAAPRVTHKHATEEKVTIDGYPGKKITGTITDSSGLEELVPPGKREMRLVLPNVKGNRFEFGMLVETKEDEKLFEKIVKSIKF